MQQIATTKVAIFIHQLSTVSALGSDRLSIDDSLASANGYIKVKKVGTGRFPIATIGHDSSERLEALKLADRHYTRLDRSVLLALLAAEGLTIEPTEDSATGINLGSSRGATQLLEAYIGQFIEEGQVSPYASPTTTAGNISSWVGQHMGVKGVRIDQSVTCSTAFHAILNAAAWLEAGMAQQFIAGGAEAALTPFTLAQMQALKLFMPNAGPECRSLDLNKSENSMVLGEGAGLALLSRESTGAILKVSSMGWSTELLSHPSSISPEAGCFQHSMKMALQRSGKDGVDAIVMHAPGTVLGDMAEYKAITQVFDKVPFLTSNKWKVGHTFGASGMISLEQAYWMIRNNRALSNPYFKEQSEPGRLGSVMINAVGFGGNAVSLIVEKP